MELSFAWVPLNFESGWQKLILWLLNYIHSNIHFNFYVRVNVMEMPKKTIFINPIQTFNGTHCEAEFHWRKQSKTPIQQKWIFSKPGPFLWKSPIFPPLILSLPIYCHHTKCLAFGHGFVLGLNNLPNVLLTSIVTPVDLLYLTWIENNICIQYSLTLTPNHSKVPTLILGTLVSWATSLFSSIPYSYPKLGTDLHFLEIN